jgi:hypothetical protein
MLGASNTYSHRQQMLAARMEAETHRMEYNLHVAEFNANHRAKVTTKAPRAILVHKHK